LPGSFRGGRGALITILGRVYIPAPVTLAFDLFGVHRSADES
jgi:hypothetical protein